MYRFLGFRYIRTISDKTSERMHLLFTHAIGITRNFFITSSLVYEPVIIPNIIAVTRNRIDKAMKISHKVLDR